MNLWRTLRVSIAAAAIVTFTATSATARHEAPGKAAEAQTRHPVLLISVDGMRPDAVLEADKYQLNIPVLRSFLKEGSYARQVVNVNPTVTNPNHTTLVTGLLPLEHGIYNNRPFAATAKLPKGYSAYAEIKAPTLWGVAKKAKLRTASIFWPVTKKAHDIDFNLVEGNDEDDQKIADDAIALIEQKRPDLLTVHFVAGDHAQHEYGPFSAEGNAALERIDTQIGRVVAAHRKAYPDSVVAIVSDHGFDKVTHQVHLNAALAEAGFIKLSGEGDDRTVTSWKAFAWYVGSSAMIVFENPRDEQTKTQAVDYLQKLAADPANGIERIYPRAEYANRGLPPGVAYIVAFKPGYRMGNSMSGVLVKKSKGGSHGAFSTRDVRPDMHSSFFITGPGIVAGKNLGTIDMRQIAPTLAGELKVSLPSAKAPVLPIR
ncbi:MAG TPA: ectonucleotide pyrophosphatase/phosphodiesterase [Sphingomonas sp.]|jgi:predicted AlkP superfamily pyrophosphatase or phosphodiesterase|nr:ectonucleotide pyrophosphatase/phosphodiesterase [Sphingomonas sp.]